MRFVSARWPLVAACLLTLGGLSACSSDKPPPVQAAAPQPPPPPPPSLADRLGGRPGIAAIVDEFTLDVAKDKRLPHRFKKAEVAPFKAQLTEQICEAAGGPCKASGNVLADQHKGTRVTEAQWKATVEDMQKAMAKLNIADADQTELLAILDKMKPDISAAPAKAAPAKKPAAKATAAATTKK